MNWIIITAMAFLAGQCTPTETQISAQNHQDDASAASEIIKVWDGKKLEKSEEEWKALLNEEEFYILRQSGTERAFSGDFYNKKESGDYACAGCDLLLFQSDTKFKSGTGWPSFFEPVGENHVGEIIDSTYGMSRTEVVCNRCDGHLGHVFADGPEPTGLRYCINGASLDFYPKR